MVTPIRLAYWQECDKDVYCHHSFSLLWRTLWWEKQLKGTTSALCGTEETCRFRFHRWSHSALSHTGRITACFGKSWATYYWTEDKSNNSRGPDHATDHARDGQDIEKVDKFQYLESYLSEDGDVEVDIRARLGKAASVFQRLRPIWKCNTINSNVKLRLYSSTVVPTGIYASETWNTSKTRQLSYRKEDRAIRPIHGCPEKFPEYSLRTQLLFPKFVMGFCSDRH